MSLLVQKHLNDSDNTIQATIKDIHKLNQAQFFMNQSLEMVKLMAQVNGWVYMKGILIKGDIHDPAVMFLSKVQMQDTTHVHVIHPTAKEVDLDIFLTSDLYTLTLEIDNIHKAVSNRKLLNKDPGSLLAWRMQEFDFERHIACREDFQGNHRLFSFDVIGDSEGYESVFMFKEFNPQEYWLFSLGFSFATYNKQPITVKALRFYKTEHAQTVEMLPELAKYLEDSITASRKRTGIRSVLRKFGYEV